MTQTTPTIQSFQSFCPTQLNCSDQSPFCPHCVHLLELTTTVSYYHNQLKKQNEDLNTKCSSLEEKLIKLESLLSQKDNEISKLTTERDQLYKDVDKICTINEQQEEHLKNNHNKLTYCQEYHIKQMKDIQNENDKLKENLKNYSVLLEKLETNIHQRDSDLNKIHELQEECSIKNSRIETLEKDIEFIKKSVSVDSFDIINKCNSLESENRDLMIQIESLLKSDETNDQRKIMFDENSTEKFSCLPPFILPGGEFNTSQTPKTDIFDAVPGLKVDLLYDPVTPALSMCLGGYKFSRNDDHLKDSFAMLYEWIKPNHKTIMIASLSKQLYKYFEENTQIPLRKFLECCSSTIGLLSILLINSLSLHLARGKISDAFIFHTPIAKKNSLSSSSAANDKIAVSHSAIRLMHEFTNYVKDKYNCEIKTSMKNEWLNDLIRNGIDDNGSIKNAELVCEFKHPTTDKIHCYRLMMMSPWHSSFVSSQKTQSLKLNK